MIRRDLEGVIITSKKDAWRYKEYLESHYMIFNYVAWDCLNTPINEIYSLGSVVEDKQSYTVIESFKNYLARGRMYEILTMFWNFNVEGSENVEFLKTLLHDKGYNLQILVKDMINKYIDSLMERVYYVLSQDKTSIIISDRYNMDVLVGKRKRT
jgi:hypothetical protein